MDVLVINDFRNKKKKKYNPRLKIKINKKNIFLAIFGVWMIDVIMTLIMIKKPNFSESNPLYNFFYSLGGIGILIGISLGVFVFFITGFGLEKLYKWHLKKYKEEFFSKLIVYVPVLTFIFLEILTIISNLNLWIASP